MKDLLKVFIMLLVITGCIPLIGQEKAQNIEGFFANGVYDVKLRLSYEYSDYDKKNDSVSPAKGLTLSTYIGYRTASLEGFSLYAQFHNLWKIDDQYNDKAGKYAGEYDVIADPDGNRLQQFYADFTQIPDTEIRLGRQEILLDDVRFFGNIGWRQTAQAFDAVTITNKSITDTTIFLGYIDKVATIGFEEAEFDGIWLANVKYSGFKGHSQTVFAYFVDSEAEGATTSRDTATYGFRLNGAYDKLKYDTTYAHQMDYQDSENRNLNFFQGYLGYDLDGIEPGIGYSYIDGAGDAGEKAFDTLFSTAHKFNGWSDQFLSTNGGGLVNGLQDYYASLKFKAAGMNFGLVYHYFDTTESHSYSSAYGQEIDLVMGKKLTDHLKATAKLAYYDEFSHVGNPTEDEFVLWLRLDYKISGPISDPFKPFQK